MQIHSFVITGKFYTVALYKTMSSILPTAPNR